MIIHRVKVYLMVLRAGLRSAYSRQTQCCSNPHLDHIHTIDVQMYTRLVFSTQRFAVQEYTKIAFKICCSDVHKDRFKHLLFRCTLRSQFKHLLFKCTLRTHLKQLLFRYTLRSQFKHLLFRCTLKSQFKHLLYKSTLSSHSQRKHLLFRCTLRLHSNICYSDVH